MIAVLALLPRSCGKAQFRDLMRCSQANRQTARDLWTFSRIVENGTKPFAELFHGQVTVAGGQRGDRDMIGPGFGGEL